MMQNPSTWILISFSIFIILFLKKIILLTKNFLENYVNSIKQKIDLLGKESKNSELMIVSAQNKYEGIENEVIHLRHTSADNLRKLKIDLKKNQIKLHEQMETQYNNDLAIEFKLRKKNMIKHLLQQLSEAALQELESQKNDNKTSIHLDSLYKLDLKQLLNEKQVNK